VTGPVVVGYDGSKASEAALTRAIEEAGSAEAALVVVSVVEMPLEAEGPITFGVGVGDAPLPTLPIVPPPEIEGLLDAARTRVEAAGVDADYVWETGDPAGAILNEARDRSASAIVVGHGHHSRLGRWFGTDTAAEIERAAGCRVIVVDA
jgi:nucleotide-binding universal stress UspA family protein